MRALAAVIAIAAVALAIYLAVRPKHPAAAPAPERTAADTKPAETPATAPRSEPPGGRQAVRKPDPEKVARHDELARAIETARAKREAARSANAGSTKGAGADDGDQDPGLDKDYIKQQMQELVPLLEECYDQALAQDPKLAGDLTVTFTIEGEPDVGGVVTSSEIDPSSSLGGNADMAECVRETMYAMKLVPPRGGGKVTVRYPFSFATTGEE